jgi:hypothetical protein
MTTLLEFLLPKQFGRQLPRREMLVQVTINSTLFVVLLAPPFVLLLLTAWAGNHALPTISPFLSGALVVLSLYVILGRGLTWCTVREADRAGVVWLLLGLVNLTISVAVLVSSK